jgi:hypothetical protein
MSNVHFGGFVTGEVEFRKKKPADYADYADLHDPEYHNNPRNLRAFFSVIRHIP